jgi:hypothetical protein
MANDRPMSEHEGALFDAVRVLGATMLEMGADASVLNIRLTAAMDSAEKLSLPISVLFEHSGKRLGHVLEAFDDIDGGLELALREPFSEFGFGLLAAIVEIHHHEAFHANALGDEEARNAAGPRPASWRCIARCFRNRRRGRTDSSARARHPEHRRRCCRNRRRRLRGKSLSAAARFRRPCNRWPHRSPARS